MWHLRIDHYFHGSPADTSKLDAIDSKLVELKELIMAVSQELKDVLARIDAATTKIGQKLDALAQQISTNMSQADVDDLKTQLGTEADKLEAMATDPANPVPPGP